MDFRKVTQESLKENLFIERGTQTFSGRGALSFYFMSVPTREVSRPSTILLGSTLAKRITVMATTRFAIGWSFYEMPSSKAIDQQSLKKGSGSIRLSVFKQIANAQIDLKAQTDLIAYIKKNVFEKRHIRFH